jgi:DNA-directed RNA polymerase subunit F
LVKKIIEEKKLSIPEVKDILGKVYEHLERLGTPTDPFTEATYEYVNNFAKMEGKVARDVIQMLMKDYKMDENYAIQVVNIDPNYPVELQTIFNRDPNLKTLSDEDLVIMIQKIRVLQD